MRVFTQEEQQKLLTIHRQISRNLVEYYRVVLADASEYAESPQFHYDVSDILLKGTDNFAIEMFRDSGKSSLVLKAFPCYRLTYPVPDCRYIVIMKQNATLARAKLKEIITSYETNEVINTNLVQVHQRSSDAYEVSVRGKGGKIIRMRIEAYGKGASIRGLNWDNIRPQLVICDDVQDHEDMLSEVTLEKDWDWFLSDLKFLSKTGRIFLIGNNLGAKCIIERVIESGELNFQVLKLPAILDGAAVWPTRYSIEYLENEKAEFNRLGKLDIWYRERMCMAISPENQAFKQEYFKFFEEKDLPAEFNIDITIDPAISKQKAACNSSIVAVGKNYYEPDWYVLDYKFGKWNPYELIESTFALHRELSRLYPKAFIRVWVEGVAYQEALKYMFEEEMRRHGNLMFVDTFVDKSDKERRILGLVPMFKIGIIHLRQWMTALMEEALLFPAGKTVDIIDALSFHQHVKINTLTAPKKEEKKTPPGVDGNLHGLIQHLQNTAGQSQQHSIDDSFIL